MTELLFDTSYVSTDTYPGKPQMVSIQARRSWLEWAEARESSQMSLNTDSVELDFVREIAAIKGVEEIRRQDLLNPAGTVYWIVANNLSADDTEALTDATWRVVQRHPGHCISIRIEDRFGAPRRISPSGERLPLVYAALHATTASSTSYC